MPNPQAQHVRAALAQTAGAPLRALQAKLAEPTPGGSPASHVQKAVDVSRRVWIPASTPPAPGVFQQKPAALVSPRLPCFHVKVLQPAAPSPAPSGTTGVTTGSTAPPSAPPPSAAAGDAKAAEAKTVTLDAAGLLGSFNEQYQLWRSNYSHVFRFNTSHKGTRDSASIQVSSADFDSAVAQIKTAEYKTPQGEVCHLHTARSGSMGAQGVWDIIINASVNLTGRGMNYHIKKT